MDGGGAARSWAAVAAVLAYAVAAVPAYVVGGSVGQVFGTHRRRPTAGVHRVSVGNVVAAESAGVAGVAGVAGGIEVADTVGAAAAGPTHSAADDAGVAAAGGDGGAAAAAVVDVAAAAAAVVGVAAAAAAADFDACWEEPTQGLCLSSPGILHTFHQGQAISWTRISNKPRILVAGTAKQKFHCHHRCCRFHHLLFGLLSVGLARQQPLLTLILHSRLRCVEARRHSDES